ncbi:MAG: response regulator [candidate division Zixibacteria bacterium]|nr:response regulator [candidate division Zixibacteria bacterium]
MKQILVVGSDPKISQDLDRCLDSKGFKLLVSPHGKSVITSLTNVKPDLVILDLDSVDQSGIETIKKIRETDSDLPLIVLSKNPVYRERESKEKNYKVVPPPFQMEKIASLVKEALSSESAKHKQKVLLGSIRFSSQEKRRIEVGSDPDRASENPHSANQDYHHIFEQVLSPIFDRVIRDCRGHVYDRLLSGLERTMISEVLKYVNHNQVKASQLLGISRNTLRERMKRFDIF